MTFSSFNSHVTSLYQHLDLLPLDKIIVYNLGLTAYRLVTDKSVLFIIGRNDLTNPNLRRFALQHSFLLPKVRTNFGKQTVGFAAIKLWNDLPGNAKNSFIAYLINNQFLNSSLKNTAFQLISFNDFVLFQLSFFSFIFSLSSSFAIHLCSFLYI